VIFPGGYVVPVVYWSRKKIKAAMKTDPTFEKKDLMGYWDGNRIVINSSEPLWVQIEVFGHELVHTVHDYSLWLKQAYADKVKQEAGETVLDDME
jgi:Zn-dependent peptidase ImmA (M78 family)